MSSGPIKCFHCGKTVYHSELQRYDGHEFHNICFSTWSKLEKQKAADLKNQRDYLKKADVTPQYYRVGDPSGAPARMESGPEERAKISGDLVTCKCGTAVAPGKFCPECGQKVPEAPAPAPAIPARDAPAGCRKCGNKAAKGKFCSECGDPLN